MTVNISSLSVEAVKVPVFLSVAGGQVDLTGNVVSMAIMPLDVNPGVNDWQPGSWEVVNGIDCATSFIGPGTQIGTLVPGEYAVWIKVAATAQSEIPVLKAQGQVEIY